MREPAQTLVGELERIVSALPDAVLFPGLGAEGQRRFAAAMGVPPPPGLATFLAAHDGGVLSPDTRLLTIDEAAQRLSNSHVGAAGVRWQVDRSPGAGPPTARMVARARPAVDRQEAKRDRRSLTRAREAAMSATEVPSSAMSGASVGRADMKLEAVVIPIANVDRAKEFYESLGWRLDADFSFDNGFRVVQFTPPASGCSVQFGTNMTSAAPGSAQGL